MGSAFKFQPAPVCLAIEADQAIFQTYKSDTFTNGCGTDLDHGALAAVYDSTAGYYLVKNSEGRGPDALRLACGHVLQAHPGHNGLQWTPFTIRRRSTSRWRPGAALPQAYEAAHGRSCCPRQEVFFRGGQAHLTPVAFVVSWFLPRWGSQKLVSTHKTASNLPPRSTGSRKAQSHQCMTRANADPAGRPRRLMVLRALG